MNNIRPHPTKNFKFGVLQYVTVRDIITNFADAMVYKKIIPADLDCPLRLTMSLFDSKWKSGILDELRSSEIHRRLPEVSPRVLDIQMKEIPVYVFKPWIKKANIRQV